MRPILSASATVLKMLLGMLFLFSASAKLVSVENFEIYIYTFRFFSLGASFVLARAVIVGELLLGAWLLSNKFHRQACLTNFVVLILFSLFLVYVMLLGRTDDCHCFGEVAGFTPAQSLLKNAVLILLLLFVWRYADGGWRPRWWLAAPLALLPEALLVALGFAGVVHLIYADLYALIAVAVCMAVVGALSSVLLWSHVDFRTLWRARWWLLLVALVAPVATVAAVTTAPEDWTLRARQYSFNEELFREQLAPDGALSSVDGPCVISFFSVYCTHCQSAAHKLEAIRDRNGLADDCFLNVFPGNDSSDFSDFYRRSQSRRVAELPLDRTTFVHITYGRFPLVVLWTGDSVAGAYGGNISESALVDFVSHIK